MKGVAMAITDGVFKGGWVQVHIYAPTYALPHSCTGYVYCLPGRRLLDQLNDVFPGTISEARDFLPIQEGEMRALRGQSATAKFICFNKTNILFVRELEEGQSRGVGSKPSHGRYPYVSKSPMEVKIYLPFYVLTGQIHCAEGQRVSELMNLPLRFFPMTNVEISPAVGNGQSRVDFLAVNKNQVVLLEELGPKL